MKIRIIICVMILLVIGCSFNQVIAQEQLQTESEQQSQDPAKEIVHLRADHLNYRKDKIIVKDNVKIIKGETILEAATGEIFKDKNQAILKEGVVVNYSRGKINSVLMTAWLDEDKYIFEEEVKLEHVLDNEQQMTLESSYLEMFTEDNSFNASQGVVIDYNKRRLKSEIAHYNGSEQILTLEKDVLIEEDGDWIKSNKARFFLGKKEEEFDAEGNVELEFNVE